MVMLSAAAMAMLSAALRLLPVIVMLEVELESEFEPVVVKEIEPAESRFEARLVVVSVMEVPPFFLLPQLVSLRLWSCRVSMLMLSPAAMVRLPEVELPELELEVELEPSLKVFFAVEIFAAKLVKSLAAAMLTLPPEIVVFCKSKLVMLPELLGELLKPNW